MTNRHTARLAQSCAEPYLEQSHAALLSAMEAEAQSIDERFALATIELQAAINHMIAAEFAVRKLDPITTSTQTDARLILLHAGLLRSRSALFDQVAKVKQDMLAVTNTMESTIARLRDRDDWSDDPLTRQSDGVGFGRHRDFESLDNGDLSDIPF